jgi:hypothetical protein
MMVGAVEGVKKLWALHSVGVERSFGLSSSFYLPS